VIYYTGKKKKMQKISPTDAVFFMNPQTSSDELYFKKFVLIGYTDVTAAGRWVLVLIR